jgi:hypothetical protein
MKKSIPLNVFGARPEEVEEARKRLTSDQCPRRYCWYWHSLSFDWQLKPIDGCQVAEQHPHDKRLARGGAKVVPRRQCCRATGNPLHVDYYEPREPHLKADGWSENYFSVTGKEARRRRYARRQGGKRGEKKEIQS